MLFADVVPLGAIAEGPVPVLLAGLAVLAFTSFLRSRSYR